MNQNFHFLYSFVANPQKIYTETKSWIGPDVPWNEGTRLNQVPWKHVETG